MLATRDARELTLKTLVGGGEADGGGDDGDGETDHDDDARDPHHVLIDADDGDGDDEKDELHRETKLDEIGEDVSARTVHHEVGLVAEGRHEGGARGEHEQKRHLFQRNVLRLRRGRRDGKHERRRGVVGDDVGDKKSGEIDGGE